MPGHGRCQQADRNEAVTVGHDLAQPACTNGEMIAPNQPAGRQVKQQHGSNPQVQTRVSQIRDASCAAALRTTSEVNGSKGSSRQSACC
jgi:hypothetical protein